MIKAKYNSRILGHILPYLAFSSEFLGQICISDFHFYLSWKPSIYAALNRPVTILRFLLMHMALIVSVSFTGGKQAFKVLVPVSSTI